jgi:hypothetical protein
MNFNRARLARRSTLIVPGQIEAAFFGDLWGGSMTRFVVWRRRGQSARSLSGLTV